MGSDLEMKEKSETSLKVLVDRESILAPPSSGQKVKGDDHGDEASPIEQASLTSGNEDVEVNITECTNSIKALMVEDACEDATECSSSFGDTGSGSENNLALSDEEVLSSMYASNAFSSMFYQWCEPSLVRKKKLTVHWRRFIRPLMWRCKWIELKLKQLQSQALKYEKELAAYVCRKQHEFANFTESVPFSGQIRRRKVMKRKKRKRVEDTCNVATYMSDHSVFSYYASRDSADGSCLKDVRAGNSDDNNEEFKLNDTWSSLDSKDSDESYKDIIQKIEAVQSQVHEVRTRIDMVFSENPGKLGSVEKTKPSVQEQKSISTAQVSEPHLVTKNAVKARPKSGSKRQSRK